MLKKYFLAFTLGCFFTTSVIGICPGYAQEFHLPDPGIMVSLSATFNPPLLKGIKVSSNNPFKFDFILDRGDFQQEQLKIESTKLIKYFLASLTIPEKDLWVNLSPYEKERIIPKTFGLTEMGRDLLAEDYMLKQITASLMYPEGETGKKFWQRIYQEAAQRFGTTNIPVNTFNKVWIVPEKAMVYENAKAGTAYVVEAKLKVMLEQDYLAISKNASGMGARPAFTEENQLGSRIIREIVIPELTKEVNRGKNFAQLRQVYNSFILASWYKKRIRDSILSQIFDSHPPVGGVGAGSDVEFIYQRYLQAFRKGVYNYVKEEPDPLTQQIIPRKYFSGGTRFFDNAMITGNDSFLKSLGEGQLLEVTGEFNSVISPFADQAMWARVLRMAVQVRDDMFKEKPDDERPYSISEIDQLSHRINQIFPQNYDPARQTIRIVMMAHRNQSRYSGKPYLNHLLDAIFINRSVFGVHETLWDQIAATHDLYEDQLQFFDQLNQRLVVLPMTDEERKSLEQWKLGIYMLSELQAVETRRDYFTRLADPSEIFHFESIETIQKHFPFIVEMNTLIANRPVWLDHEFIRHVQLIKLADVLANVGDLKANYMRGDKDFHRRFLLKVFSEDFFPQFFMPTKYLTLEDKNKFLDAFDVILNKYEEDKEIKDFQDFMGPIQQSRTKISEIRKQIADAAMSASGIYGKDGQPIGYNRSIYPSAWDEVDNNYQPFEFTAPELLENDISRFSPEQLAQDLLLGWANAELPSGGSRPRNPRGPTGLAGRGYLGKWGANLSVDAIVTRFNPKIGKLQVLAVLREDADQWALPGGFIQRGENLLQARRRVLREKTGIDFPVSDEKPIYQGYVNDPRNTDNAWVETEAYHINLPYDKSRQLIPKAGGNNSFVAWLNVDEALEKHELYANHGDILKQVIYEMPTSIEPESKPVAKALEVQPADFIRYNKVFFNFKAIKYDAYTEKLREKKGKIAEFTKAFFSDFVEVVKAYEQSGDWKYYDSDRKYFIKPGEKLLDALEKNGFYKSKDFFFDRLVRRYLLAQPLSGGEMVPISLNLSALPGTRDYIKWEQDRDLMKEIIKETMKEFQEGKLTIGQIHTKGWFRKALGFSKEGVAIGMKEVMRGGLAYFMNWMTWLASYITTTLGFSLLPSMLLSAIPFLAIEFCILPTGKATKIKMDELEHAYYERILQNYILGRTFEDERKTRADFEDSFNKMSQVLVLVDQIHGVRDGELNRRIFDQVKRYILKGVKFDYHQYLWIAELGKELVLSGISTDTRTVSMAMLKELSDQNRTYFDRLVVVWQKEADRVNVLRKFAMIFRIRVGRFPCEEFLDMLPLIRIQQHEDLLNKEAQERAEKILKAEGVVDDHGLEVEIGLQRIKLRTAQRLQFHGIFTNDFLDTVLIMNSMKDRRALILSYFMAGGGARLRLISESIQNGKPFNPVYSSAVNRVAKFIWVGNLNRILKAQEEYERVGQGPNYGFSVAEVKSMLDRLNAHRIYSSAETFRREVLNKIPYWVYDGMAQEVKEIVDHKDTVEDLRGSVTVMPDHRHYDVFRKIMEADKEYWEGFAGIVHQGFLEAGKNQADAEAVNKEVYQNSLMVDVRLFDEEYVKKQVQHIVAQLTDALDQQSPEVRHFLAHVRGEPGHEVAAHVTLKIYHLAAVAEYLANRITVDEMEMRIINFYKIAKRLPEGENLSELLLEKLRAEFKMIEELKKAEGNQIKLDTIKKKMSVIIDPLSVSWAYLMGQVPKFGKKAGERRAWLVSLQRSAIGIIGILQNEHFFDDIQLTKNVESGSFFQTIGVETAEEQLAALKLRKLLRYFYGVLDLEENPRGGNGQGEHNFNWLADQGGLLESNWFVIREMITELGLDAEDRFKDILVAGDKAAEMQSLGLGGGNLSNMIRTLDNVPDAAMSSTYRDKFERGQDSLEVFYSPNYEKFELVFLDGSSPSAESRKLFLSSQWQEAQRFFQLGKNLLESGKSIDETYEALVITHVTSTEEQMRFYQRMPASGRMFFPDGRGTVSLSYLSSDPTVLRNVVQAFMTEHAQGARVLSIGDGQGHFAEALQKENVDIYSADISLNNVQIAKDRGVRNSIVGNAYQLPYLDHTFDEIILNESIGALDLERVFPEARRILKPGGKIMITMYPSFSQEIGVQVRFIQYTQGQIEQALRKYGFIINADTRRIINYRGKKVYDFIIAKSSLPLTEEVSAAQTLELINQGTDIIKGYNSEEMDVLLDNAVRKLNGYYRTLKTEKDYVPALGEITPGQITRAINSLNKYKSPTVRILVGLGQLLNINVKDMLRLGFYLENNRQLSDENNFLMYLISWSLWCQGNNNPMMKKDEIKKGIRTRPYAERKEYLVGVLKELGFNDAVIEVIGRNIDQFLESQKRYLIKVPQKVPPLETLSWGEIKPLEQQDKERLINRGMGIILGYSPEKIEPLKEKVKKRLREYGNFKTIAEKYIKQTNSDKKIKNIIVSLGILANGSVSIYTPTIEMLIGLAQLTKIDLEEMLEFEFYVNYYYALSGTTSLLAKLMMWSDWVNGKKWIVTNRYAEMPIADFNLLHKSKGEEAGRKKEALLKGRGYSQEIIEQYLSNDSAMMIVKKKVFNKKIIDKLGGIDLSSDKALTIQNSGPGIKFHIDPSQIRQWQQATGIVPIIINIRPLRDLKSFLGANV